MFASNIGSVHFVGQAGSAASIGIGVMVFELNGIVVMPLLAWLFAPVYLASRASTMPQYLRIRFGGRRIQIYISSMALLLYIFTKISADLYAGTYYLESALGIPSYAGILILLVVGAFITIIGGINAVFWTNVMQVVVILCGATYMLVCVLEAVFKEEVTSNPNFNASSLEALFVGFAEASPKPVSELNHSYHHAEIIKRCGESLHPDLSFHLIHPPDDEYSPWPGVMVGLTISSIWYWCADQMMVQHILASRNLTHAKFGVIFASVLKFLGPFFFVIPGMASRVLYTDVIACSDPFLCQCYCKSDSGCSNLAYTIFVQDHDKNTSIVHNGGRGLMAATISAALISSFTVGDYAIFKIEENRLYFSFITVNF